MIWQRAVGAGLLGVMLTVTPAAAQVQTEISGLFGWTFSDGVSGEPFVSQSGVFDRVDPKDSIKWGLMAGVLVGGYGEAGFMYTQQPTTLEASGTNTVEIGDQTITTYHGYFAYNFGEPEATVRPYVLGGLGATSYGSIDFRGVDGIDREIRGETQFSTTWGAGVKIYPTPSIGVRLGVQFTPTYIKSDAEGYWCDPYWGCYLVGDAQYANQWDLLGGVIIRF